MPPSDEFVRRDRFEAIYRAHVVEVRRYCSRRVTPDVVDDAVAETFTVLWRRLDDAPDQPRLWLLAVARRIVANQIRSGQRRVALLARLMRDHPRSDPAADESHAEILTAVHNLPRMECEAVMLVHWDGLTPAEAAVVVGCSPVAMRSRLHRARRHLLRTLYASPPPEEHPCEKTA